MVQSKRIRWKRQVFHWLRCCAKVATFLFWASLCLVTMKLCLFKSNSPAVARDWAIPDNYSKWLLQGPVLGDDYSEADYQMDTYFYYSIEADLTTRAAKLERACQQHDLTDQPINSKEFFIDHKHNFVYCNIFKAASSSWLYKFNILGGYAKKFLSKTRHTPLMLARRKFPRPTVLELREAISNPAVVSLLVVREPFVRLLSAYRDKLENITPPYYRKLAKSIVAEHRDEAIKIFGPIRSFGPTFYEFVAYLIDKYKSNKEGSFDEHWAPYYNFCSPCAVNFTVIAKVETLARDSAYVIQQLGVEHLLGNKVTDRRTRLRTVMNKSKDGRNTTSLLKYYFKQLDKRMLDDLLQIYGIDFDMFGYDSDVYSRYVRK